MEALEERIERFLAVSSGYGYGYGAGYGAGYGDGAGYGYGAGAGDGYGYGYGYGYGSGSGSGDGSGDGDGYGSGDGDGDGDGYGSGSGSGSGSGYGDGISSFNGRKVYMIDSIPTLIDSIRGNIAKGAVLRDDLTLQPCYVVKENDLFAHGDTLHDAMQSLQEKLMQKLPIEERIKRFLAEHNTTDKYPARDLFEWHHHLTGSCRFGRENFCHSKGIDVDHDEFTVREFIDLTINAYGSDVIRSLKKEIEGL